MKHLQGPQRTPPAIRRKGRRTADRILDVATDQLARHGYGALSLRKVAAGAGLSLSNLQYHFPAKHDLVHALLDRYLTRGRELLTERLEGAPPTPEARVRRIVSALHPMDGSASDAAVFREIWALSGRDEHIAALVGDYYDAVRQQTEMVVTLLNPTIEPAERVVAATAIVALIDGLVATEPSQAGRRPGTRQIVRLFKRLSGALD